jgi:2-polyprenyl-6-hydroxyphenyl methylase/3-demethylubiquinone-9 3-methyltransferase
VPPGWLLQECLRIVRPGGHVLLSSYAPGFWDHRLNWFRRQAREGLLGPIDEDATGNGEIVCRDGFRATTFSPEAFGALARDLDVPAKIETVDESSIFCDIQVPGFNR